MVIFNTDLDNTIIYSYKHNIGSNKKCVEVYQGREISFVTEKTAELVKRLSKDERILFVPTTTRTLEQYSRIDLGIGTPRYALVCNGGVLLVNGVEDEDWYNRSLQLVQDCQSELALAESILENDENRSFELRNIRNLFVFTKSSEPLISVERLRSRLDPEKMSVFNNGVKVYALPKVLSKGKAILRLKDKLGADKVIAAGDSEFDITMLNGADVAIAPEELFLSGSLDPKTIVIKNDALFSDELLIRVVTKVIL